MPVPDCADPTLLDGWSGELTEELEVSEELDVVELLEEVDEESDVDPLVTPVEDWPAEAEVPGMVAALTTPNTPTPANAARAAPVVSRLRRRSASSRRSLAWIGWSLSITITKLGAYH